MRAVVAIDPGGWSRVRRACTLLAAATLALAGCERPAPQSTETIRTVQVVRVGPPPEPRTLDLAGEVRARHETRLAFQVGGRMVERLVEVGSRVAAEQPVARVDPRDLRLLVDAAQAVLVNLETDRDLAAVELERARNLFTRNFVARAELDRRAATHAAAQARVDAARAQVDQARNQLGYAVLRSDHAGVVTAIEAEVGQVVAVGQTVIRIARPGEMEVAVSIPEVHREALARARAITVTANALPGARWVGRLRELAPAAEPATRTYPARIGIAAPSEGLALGMSARVLVTAEETPKGFPLPPAAIHARGQQAQVWVIDAAGLARARDVVTAGVGTDSVIIGSGLTPGELVVTAGAQLLREGEKVRVQQAAPPATVPR